MPLVPGRLGPHRGDVLSSVVDDVDTALDGQLRVRAPLASGALVVAGTAAFAALVAPPRPRPVAVAALVGGGAALLLSWLVGAAGRAGLRRGPGPALRPRGRGPRRRRRPRRLAGRGPRRGRRRRRRPDPRWAARGAAAGAATGRAVAVVAAGAGVVAVLQAGAPAYAAGALSGPMLALLALLPLALLDVLLPLADVGPLAVRIRAARLRLDALAGLDPAVTDPADAQARRSAAATSGWRAVDAGWGDHPGADRGRPRPPRGRPGRRGGPVRAPASPPWPP